MSFRTLDINQAAELHIKNGQLLVTMKEGHISIPIEDLSHVFLHGANIRLSSMDLSIFSRYKVGVTTLDDKYLPTAIVLPFEGNSRQSKLMHAQIRISEGKRIRLWKQIIIKKISNQSRTLALLGLDGAENVIKYIKEMNDDSVDKMEALAAKTYFEHYHNGLNRRSNDSVNSRLNYGYAVVRSAIARSLTSVGFHPTFGIHHNSQLNAFNLADDLIEPYRPMVDLIVYNCTGSNLFLSKKERKDLTAVLHNACKVEGAQVNTLGAIEMMVESLKRIVLEDSSEDLLMPTILPVCEMKGITE